LTVILSDGDVVFQPRKVQRSGLWESVEGRVLIYIHKEQMLDDVRQRYPAQHYFMFDDKLRILAAMKKVWRSTDDGFYAPGTLRPRFENSCSVSSCGYHSPTQRRSGRDYYLPALLEPEKDRRGNQ
jgi:hypothetical protein